MKGFLALVAFATAALLNLQGCDKKDNYINESLLPTEAQAFLSAHFPAVEVKSVVKDFDDFSYTYRVSMADGSHIEFKKNGEWREVKNLTSGVPNSILPTKILEYLQTNYPNNYVVEIDRGKHYDIELNDGLDLEFSASGDFIRFDR